MPPHLTIHSKTTRGGRADRLRAVVELHHYKTLAARRGGRMGEGQVTDDTDPGGGGGGGVGSAVQHANPQPPSMSPGSAYGTPFPPTAYLGVDGHMHYALVSGDYGYGIPPKFQQPEGAVSSLQAANPGLDWTSLPAGFDLLLPDAWFDPSVLAYGNGGGGGGGGGGGTTVDVDGQPPQIDVTPVVDPGTPAASKPWTKGQKVAIGAAGVATAGAIGWGVWYWMKKKRKGRR